jgi:hypothetical protein
VGLLVSALPQLGDLGDDALAPAVELAEHGEPEQVVLALGDERCLVEPIRERLPVRALDVHAVGGERSSSGAKLVTELPAVGA